MNRQKGFSTLWGIIILLIISGGVYFYTQNEFAGNLDTDKQIGENFNESKDVINNSVGKQLVTEVIVKNDTEGNVLPSLVVDPDVATDLVVEKYGGIDSAYTRQLIEVRWKALGAGLIAEASFKRNQNNGSYVQSCDGTTEYLKTQITNDMQLDEEEGNLLKKLGITLESYNIDKFKCIDSEIGFVATVPLVLKDGVNIQYCISSTGTGQKDADWENLTCIK